MNRQTDESIKDYKIRLFDNKDKYGLTCQQIADLINKETGDNFTESVYRKWFVNFCDGRDYAISRGISDDKILKEFEDKKVELQKEKYKFYDQRNAFNSVIRKDARHDELKEIIKLKVQEIIPYQTNIKTIERKSNNDLKIDINDIHFGIEVDNYWNKYNPEIAKERLEKYLQEIIKIQKLHKSENCFVCANGDLISGSIHLQIQIANRENLVGQIMGVSELLSWFLSELSNYFNQVNFSVVAGNHSRIGNKDESPKSERLDDLIPWYVKSRLQNISNVIVSDNQIDNTMSLLNIRGLNYLNVHGDIDNMNNILKLVEMLPDKIYAICSGHLHHNKTDWSQGYKILMSGSLLGVDDYCISKRIFGKPQQLVCVCTEDGVLCTYDVELD